MGGGGGEGVRILLKISKPINCELGECNIQILKVGK